jgi:predicted esterase
MEEVRVPNDLDAYVLRGARGGGRLRVVFVPGMCVHPLGYAQAFQNAAAAHGEMIAVQGDTSCGGDGAARRWTSDLATMDRRIDAAFAAAGLDPPADVTLVGYSQGAERAERLAARYPDKYTRVVLMASPVRPSAARLEHARAAVMMAGTYDVAHGRMKGSVESLRRRGVPSTFIEIPGARHGGMGLTPEPTMDEALDFVASR